MEPRPVCRILIVDEEPEVLAIARLFLEREEGIVVETAISPACALAKMAVTSYDAVVSDYLMPEMDGIAFLREVRSRYGDIPFIMMTAHSREEVVIEALNSGATGYLQKGADIKEIFVELIHLIQNAVGKREVERALAESEVRYNDIVENAHDLIHSVRPDGSFIFVNRAWRETLGYSAEEADSMTVYDVIAPDVLDAYMEMFSGILHGNGQRGFETAFLAKDGRVIPVRGNVTCQMSGRVPVVCRGIFYTISRPEISDAEVYAMLAAIQNLPLPIMVTDENGMIVRTNSRAHTLFQQTDSLLSGTDVRHFFVEPGCWDRIVSLLHENRDWQGEAVMRTADEYAGCVLPLCCAAAYCSDGIPGMYSLIFPGNFLSDNSDCDVGGAVRVPLFSER